MRIFFDFFKQPIDTSQGFSSKWMSAVSLLGSIRWIRVLGLLILCSMPQACAICIHDPVNPHAKEHTSFCAQYYQEGKLVEAEARCRLAREFAPKYAEPVNLLGLIAYSRGQHDLARNFYKEAISLKDDFVEAYNNMGALYLDDRDLKSAAEQFKQALEIDPGYVNARVNYGLCLLLQNKLKNAKDEYLKCMELEPQACDCRTGLGMIAAKQDDLEEARLQFSKVTEICPQQPSGFYNLCKTYFELGQCGSALESCMRAVALKPDYAEARKNLVAATECLALEDQAIKDYTDKIKRNPGNAELHFNLGRIYAQKHLLESAVSEFLNSIKIKVDYTEAYYRLAKVYDEQLRVDDTIKMCREFVDKLRNEKMSEERDWCVNRVKELQYQ